MAGDPSDREAELIKLLGRGDAFINCHAERSSAAKGKQNHRHEATVAGSNSGKFLHSGNRVWVENCGRRYGMSKIQLNSLFRSIWGRSLPHRVVQRKCVNTLKTYEVLYKIRTMVDIPMSVLASMRTISLEEMMYIIKNICSM